MIVGTRILYPEETGFWNAEFLQISVYNGMKGNLDIMMQCVRSCRKAGIRYVIHPVGYSLFQEELFPHLRHMAEWTDMALVLHDERTPDGKRLYGKYDALFRNALEELKSITPVSLENATNTRDVLWFWNNFADSITLDIGHVESCGLDSLGFVRALDKNIIKKIKFVHMHRNNGLRGGITDHWPLSPTSRELTALRELVRKKSDIIVILEINEIEMTDDSLGLLRALRDETQE